MLRRERSHNGKRVSASRRQTRFRQSPGCWNAIAINCFRWLKTGGKRKSERKGVSMMERLVTVKDMQERYGCSLPTARKYLRQMYHYENPLSAPRWAFEEWEQSRERMPAGINSARQVRILQRRQNERTIVPRKRD